MRCPTRTFTYYAGRGVELRRETFAKNLGLLTPGGRYNMLAQLLSDNCHMPVRVSLFAGASKTSTLYSVREFGNTCLLVALDSSFRLNNTQGHVLNAMRDNPNITHDQLMSSLGLGRTSIQNAVTYLRKHGFIERAESNKTGWWRVL